MQPLQTTERLWLPFEKHTAWHFLWRPLERVANRYPNVTTPFRNEDNGGGAISQNGRDQNEKSDPHSKEMDAETSILCKLKERLIKIEFLSPDKFYFSYGGLPVFKDKPYSS